MKTEHFKLEMTRIARVFGAANYPADRNRLIWAEVSDLPDDRFSKIVNHFIGNRKIEYPPMLKDFIEEAHQQRKVIATQQAEEARRILERESIKQEKQEAVLNGQSSKSIDEHAKEAGLADLLHALRKGKGRGESDRPKISEAEQRRQAREFVDKAEREKKGKSDS